MKHVKLRLLQIPGTTNYRIEEFKEATMFRGPRWKTVASYADFELSWILTEWKTFVANRSGKWDVIQEVEFDV